MHQHILQIRPGDPSYPRLLELRMRGTAPSEMEALGDTRLLLLPQLGLLVSLRCPGTIVLETFDAVRSLPSSGWAVAGGFHSPVERQCLASLLLKRVPVIITIPRPVSGMRIPSAWKDPLHEGRMLVLSPFPDQSRRFTRDRANRRNVVVAALADILFVPYAAEGGSVETCVGMAFAWGVPVLTVAGNSQPLLHGRSEAVDGWVAGRPTRQAEERFVLT